MDAAAFAQHDHSKCTSYDGVASLPEKDCGDRGHAGAVDEAGWCSVCQH